MPVLAENLGHVQSFDLLGLVCLGGSDLTTFWWLTCGVTVWFGGGLKC